MNGGVGWFGSGERIILFLFPFSVLFFFLIFSSVSKFNYFAGEKIERKGGCKGSNRGGSFFPFGKSWLKLHKVETNTGKDSQD